LSVTVHTIAARVGNRGVAPHIPNFGIIWRRTLSVTSRLLYSTESILSLEHKARWNA